jgi:hypothetical protein
MTGVGTGSTMTLNWRLVTQKVGATPVEVIMKDFVPGETPKPMIEFVKPDAFKSVRGSAPIAAHV